MKLTLRYFSWLSFANTLLIAGEMLRVRKPVADYMAAWALLGIYLTVVFFVIALLIAGATAVGRRLHVKFVEGVAESILFGFLFVSWINFLRMSFLAFGIHPLWLPTRPLLLFSLGIGILLFPLFQRRMGNRLAEITRNMRVVSTLALSLWGASLLLFFIRSSAPRHPVNVSFTPGAPTPNIIYLVMDAMSARDMSLYGYSLKTTPQLEALAKTWTVYDDAHSAGTGTVANMPAVLTGRYPVITPWNLYGHLAGRVKGWLSLTDILRARGYETLYLDGGGIPPNYFHFQNSFDKVISAGTGWYFRNDPLTWCSRLPPALWNALVGKSLPVAFILPAASAIGAAELIEPMYGRMETFLKNRVARNGRRPFFLYMHMLGPHAPYIANQFTGRLLPRSEGFATLRSQLPFLNFPQAYAPGDQSKVDKLRLRYDEAIEKTDAQVAQFIDALKQNGLYDSSMIVITADHGTNFSNGYVGYYTPLISAAEHSIPLIVKLPGQTQGRRVQGLVSTLDFMPTVLHLLKINAPANALDGQILPTAQGDLDRVIYVCNASDPAHSYAALYQNFVLVQRDHLKALFNLQSDPGETKNLINGPSLKILEDALAQFKRWITVSETHRSYGSIAKSSSRPSRVQAPR